MTERFDTPEAVKARLKQIAMELSEARLAGWPEGPDSFHLRRIQVFCELIYADLIMRTAPTIADQAEVIARKTAQKAAPPRDFVGELETMAGYNRPSPSDPPA